ncbi:MAG: TRAP transporter TatT component family protein [Bacteroidota bacterium]
MNRLPAVILLLSFLFTGCIQQIAISTVGGIVNDGFGAFTEEQDLDLAEKALPSNLKLLEVMLKSDPGNEEILLLLSQGYNSYALGFVEDHDPERARMLYQRGVGYAMRILREDELFARAFDGRLDDLKSELAKKGKDDVPAVFWAAFGLGSYIQLSLTHPEAIADLPKAEMMMKFVVSTDSTFYYGGAHVFLGTLYGSRPKMLGGNVELSRHHFETALRINGGKFLMTYVYYARSYAVQTLNEALFEELLARVNDASLEILPEFRLANAIAKKKGESLQSRKMELF